MNTERNLNKWMAAHCADALHHSLFQPEPEHSVANQLNAGLADVKARQGVSSLFMCVFAAMAVLWFVLTQVSGPVVPAQSAVHSPVLMDGEMAVIHRLEQVETDACAQSGIANSYTTTRQSEIDWLQIIHQLNYQLKKALMVKQVHRFLSVKKKALYKLKYLGPV